MTTDTDEVILTLSGKDNGSVKLNIWM